MDIRKFDIKKIILSKLNIKLTLLFIIVGLVAPSLAIYYFYTISLSAMTLSLSPEKAPLLKTAIVTIVVLIAVNAGVLGFFVSKSISKPIKELYKATRKVEKGNYNVQ